MHSLHAKIVLALLFLLQIGSFIDAENKNPAVAKIHQLIGRVLQQCIQWKFPISCVSERAAVVIERARNSEVILFEGLTMVPTNKSDISKLVHAREKRSGFQRLVDSVAFFWNNHAISVDLGKARGEGGEYGGGKKGHKKERKYMQYAFMVLLGIFGLTGPLVMKTLGVIAAKALIASKVALIIVGSVALKKIFEKDHDPKGSVKVHTITAEDDYDRIFSNRTPSYTYYAPYDTWSRPYS